MAAAAAAVCLATVAEVAAVTACAAYALKGEPPHVHSWTGLFADSNLDVWLLTVVLAALLCTCLLGTWLLVRRWPAAAAARRLSYVQRSVVALYVTAQVLLLAKCVVVAVLASDDVYPSESSAGLLSIALAVGSAFTLQWVQWAAAAQLLSQWQAALQNLGGPAEPLLGKEDRPLQKPATVKALLHLSAADTPLLTVAFLAGSLAALGQALIPYYTGHIIDYASIDPDAKRFKTTIFRLVGISLGCAIFTGIRGGLFTVGMTRLNVRIRTQLFHSLLRQEIGFFEVTRAGDITSRLAADTTTISDQVCLNMNVMMRSITSAAMVFVFMWAASWRLTVVTCLSIPATLVITKLYGAYYRKLAKRVQTSLADANVVADEVLSTMTTVRAHAAEDSAKAAYAQRLQVFFHLQRKEALAYAAYAMTNTFLPNLVAALVLFYGGHLVLSSRMSAGALVSFMLYQQSLSSSFQSLGDVASSLTAAVGAADKVVELMKRQPAIPPSGTLAPADFQGRIELRNVSFSYPARPTVRVLSGLNLALAPGEVVALVGPSGGCSPRAGMLATSSTHPLYHCQCCCRLVVITRPDDYPATLHVHLWVLVACGVCSGKSSIVKLIERFYVPSAGALLLDGRDVGDYDPKWLKRRVAIVSQEPTLYARSIRRNICFGLEPEDGVPPQEAPSQADVEEAARQANAHGFITALPEGYDADCGERGVSLSGGQKQRIAIARALVRRPSLLLLDEATSALDADSEAVVQEALDRMMRKHTVLVIAHRLSTVQGADRICVIAGGALVEQGTHEGLLEAGGMYAQLVRRQLSRTDSQATMASMRGAASYASLPPDSSACS